MSDIFDIGDFGCQITSATYNIRTGTGHVHMPAGNCTDMERTIKQFKEHIPDISHIVTWCDGELDTQYIVHDGAWIAI